MVAKVEPKRKPRESKGRKELKKPKEPYNNVVIAVSANPIEYVGDQAPQKPPGT